MRHPVRVSPSSLSVYKMGTPHRGTQGVQVKLWDPLRMCAIAEHLRGCSWWGAIQIHVYLCLTLLPVKHGWLIVHRCWTASLENLFLHLHDFELSLLGVAPLLVLQPYGRIDLIHCVSKKLTLLFLWLLCQMLTSFNNIWWYCSWENLQLNDIFLSYNIQIVYEYYRIEKQDRFCMLSMLPSSRHASFLQLFQKFVQSLQSPALN